MANPRLMRMSFTHLGEVIDHFVVLAHHVGHLIFVSIQSAPDEICHRFLVRHHLLENVWYCRHGAYHTGLLSSLSCKKPSLSNQETDATDILSFDHARV